MNKQKEEEWHVALPDVILSIIPNYLD